MCCFYPVSGFAWGTSLPLADNKPAVPSYPFSAGWRGGQIWGQYAIFLGIIKIKKFLLWPTTLSVFFWSEFFSYPFSELIPQPETSLTDIKEFLCSLSFRSGIEWASSNSSIFYWIRKMISFVKQFHALLSPICLQNWRLHGLTWQELLLQRWKNEILMKDSLSPWHHPFGVPCLEEHCGAWKGYLLKPCKKTCDLMHHCFNMSIGINKS